MVLARSADVGFKPGCTMRSLRAVAYVAAGACSVALLLGCEKPATAVGEAQPAASRPSVATWNNPNQIKAQCVIQSQRAVKLKAELGGRIDTVEVLQGQVVDAGQLLARIGTQEQELALERLRLAQRQAQAKSELLTVQIAQAQATWAAVQVLYKELPKGAQAKEALVVAERQAELNLTQLGMVDLQLQMKNLERVLRQAQIRSPMRGVVLNRNAEVGMVVAPGISGFNGSDILFELGDPEKLRVECAARESDAAQLKAGLPVQLVLDGARGQEIALAVSRVAPAIQNEAGSSSLLFWGDFDRPANIQVLAGMHGVASVKLESTAQKATP